MIIEFPKEPRSEFEKILRAALTQHSIKLPEELTTALSKDFDTVLQKWQTVNFSLSYKLPSSVTPEIAREIEKIVTSACHEAMRHVIGNATKERIELWTSGRLTAGKKS
jgi:hypothetical protein